MKQGPIIQASAVVFLRARHMTSPGRYDAEAETRSMDRQRKLCEQVAGNLEVPVVKEYVEHGETGPIFARPVLRQMLRELKTLGNVTFVLVYNFDRIARDPKHLLLIQKQIQAADATVLAAEGWPGLDPNDSAHRDTRIWFD